MQRQQVLELVHTLLHGETTMVLATTDGRGDPCAAPLFFYAGAGPRLWWMSSEASAHSRNVEGSATVAAAVYAPAQAWQDIRGVQLQGRARAATPAERSAMLHLYRRRFGLGQEFDAVIAESTLYVLQPTWLRYLDNSLGFGFSEELRFDEPPHDLPASNLSNVNR